MDFLKLFVPTYVYVVVLDLIWLGFIAKNIYKDAVGPLMRETPNYYAAALVYVAITLGILLFSLPKSDGTYVSALIWGGIFGFIIYGVYDYTNLAVLSGWPWSITLIDITWGCVLCALTTGFASIIRGYVN